MATHSLLPNHRYRVRRSSTDQNGSYDFLCVVTAKSITFANTYSQAMQNDCDDPDALPEEVSVKTGRNFRVSFSGIAAPEHLSTLLADSENEAPTWYRLELDPADGVGAGYFQVALHFENLEIGASDGGHATFSVSARGQSVPSFTAA